MNRDFCVPMIFGNSNLDKSLKKINVCTRILVYYLMGIRYAFRGPPMPNISAILGATLWQKS